MVDPHNPLCSGCTACMAICPENAILMVANKEGFVYPQINKTLCTQCGLCSSICPIDNPPKYPFEDYFFAAANADADQLEYSASGGIFPVLAKDILQRGGLVCGCILDDAFVARHVLTCNPHTVHAMSKSKYVQSDMGLCFILIQKALAEGQEVLFSGTPCQVGGLRSFLGKEHSRLFCMDFVCHGVPSPLVFKYYIEDAKIEEPSLASVSFRDKRMGWGKSVRMTWRDARGNVLLDHPISKDAYLKAFIDNQILRECCSHCQYATPQRPSDITVGDFWGIEHQAPSLFDDKGLSLLLCNTEKGKKILHDNRSAFGILRRLPFKTASYNACFYRPLRKGEMRQNILAKLTEGREGFMNNLKKDLSPVGIFSFTGVDNYGGVLQSYALAKTIQNFGHYSEHLNIYAGTNLDSPFASFRDKYLIMSEPIYNFEQCALANSRYETIITGSDQVWNERYSPCEMGMLAWAHGRKTLIAYAASFGEDYISSNNQPNTAKLLLKRFDAISVREDSGVNICDNLNIKSTHVLDPSLLLEWSDYEEIISDAKSLETPQDYIVAYFTTKSSYMDNFIEGLREKGETVIELRLDPLVTIPEWLNYFRNAKYVLTDSYHGLCFSIIFQKQVIVLDNRRDNARIPSLLSMLDINKTMHRFDKVEVSVMNKEQPIDYAVVTKRLETLREHSLNFLREALAIPPAEKEEFFSSMLRENGIVTFHEAHEKEQSITVDRQRLYAWANSFHFDASLKHPRKDHLRLAVDCVLNVLPLHYTTNDPDTLQQRKFAYELLLADAHRILKPGVFSLVENDPDYIENPHLLRAVIQQTIRDRHQQYLYREIERLCGMPVYYFGCGEMYKRKRDMFASLKPQAIIVDHVGKMPTMVDMLPVHRATPFLMLHPPLPVIIFSGAASVIAQRLNRLYPEFQDIVACAMF